MLVKQPYALVLYIAVDKEGYFGGLQQHADPYSN